MQGRLHTREDSGLVLDREGRWFHDGVLVEHPKIVEAFNRGIERDEQGRYVLRFGGDWCFITVEDAPLQVETASPAGESVVLALSNGRTEPLRPETLALRGGVLYCAAESGLTARFGRSAQFSLGSLLEERPDGYVLVLGGREHRVLGSAT
ncbi:MAG TPA: DUF1285 domain-containing protein [Myxococcales bacterium]|jgi:hypothetical protein